LKRGDLAVFHFPGDSSSECWFVPEELIKDNPVVESNLFDYSKRIYLHAPEFNGHVVELLGFDAMGPIYIPALRLYSAQFGEYYLRKI
jgi:hypothetical protein